MYIKKLICIIFMLLYAFLTYYYFFDVQKVHSTYFTERKETLKNTKIVIRSQPKGSKVEEMYYKNPQPYEHVFKYLINEPTLCSQYERVLLLYAVRTIYSHFDRRETLRKIFLNVPQDYYSKDIIIKHVFLFAKTSNSTTESLIHEESKIYGDILQEDFEESYLNVYLKTIMAWKWSVEFCANADYVMILNDELFIDQYKLVQFLRNELYQINYEEQFSFCFCLGNGISKQNNFKKFRELDQKYMYKGKYYPRYCHGVGYIAPINVINKLYLASLKNRMLMPDDVWIGVLSEMLNINVKCTDNRFHGTNLKTYYSKNYLDGPVIASICDYREKYENVVYFQKTMYNVVSKLRRKDNFVNISLQLKDNKNRNKYFFILNIAIIFIVLLNRR